jgi:hypothetical protein
LAELDKRFMAKCEGRHISNAPLTSYSYVYIAAELIRASKAKGGDFYTGEILVIGSDDIIYLVPRDRGICDP